MLPMSQSGKSSIRGKDLELLEKELRIKFPPEYRQFMLAHNGGIPEQNSFMCTTLLQGRVLSRHIAFFYSLSDDEATSIRLANQDRKPHLQKLIAIASDGTGNDLCLDLSPNALYGRVFFRERNLYTPRYYLVADSFQRFIDCLADFDRVAEFLA